MELTLTKQDAETLLKFLDAARTYYEEQENMGVEELVTEDECTIIAQVESKLKRTNMSISCNEREKEILIDVLEAHLETLDDRLNDGDTELQEERDATESLLSKVRED